MVLRKVLALRGPNVWGKFPLLEVWADLNELEGSPADPLVGFDERLASRVSPDRDRTRGESSPGDAGREGRGVSRVAEALGDLTLEFQQTAGAVVGFRRAVETREPGVYRVAVEYEEEEFARACLAAAHELCLATLWDRPFDLAAGARTLRDLAHRVCLGPSTLAVVDAARARGIPVRRLNSGSLVQFGQGARQRRILATETDRTGAIAESIAQDKELTRTLLREAGVPVPEGRPVTDAEDAWAAAKEIGGAVVVKPRYGNQGRGVATDLRTREQVTAAYDAAAVESSHVVVERFAPGADYRLLVVGGRLAAAARREPAMVTGDGSRTVRALIEEVNRDPRRSEGHATALSPIPLDAVSLGVLAAQGHTPDSVPPAGARVLIRRNANLSTGGTAADVTASVHPEVATRAGEAAAVIGLDVAGIDVVALDVGRPLTEQGGVIVEVNAGPGLRMHLEPSSGSPRPVGEAIVKTLFRDGDDGRIPVVAVTGVNGKTTTTRLIAHILHAPGARVGMTCTDGIYLEGRKLQGGDCSGPASARAVLSNPGVDAAVLETARGGILRAGLGFDRCRVAVVTNIGEGDHLGIADIETPAELARVKRTVVDAAEPDGVAVLNAGDPLVAAMGASCPCPVIFFAPDGDHPVVREHRDRGGRAVFVRGGLIVLAEGAGERPLVPVAEVPLTHAGRVAFQTENVLAATAAAWGLGVPDELLRSRLGSFAGDERQAPGRFNVLTAAGITVVVDYGHNPTAVAALARALDAFPNPRRSVVFTAAGDRRDADIVRQGEILGDAVDRAILYEDRSTRGRPPGAIIALLRRGLAAGRRVSEVIDARDESEAVTAALAGATPGELLVFQPDSAVEDSIALILGRLNPATRPAAGGPPTPISPDLRPVGG